MNKNLAFLIKNVDDRGNFEGRAAAFENVDADGEIFDKGAFRRTIAHKEGRIPLLWQHDRTEPVGWNRTISEDDHGLNVGGQLMINCDRGCQAYEFIKTGIGVGAQVGLSIGFRVPKGGDYRDDQGVRHFREVELVEYSIVTFPANGQAHITNIKEAVDDLKKQSTEVQSLVVSKGSFDDLAAAKKWIADHDFLSDEVDETKDSWRFRQFSPGDCQDDSFRTIDLSEGVKAVICKRKEKR